MHFKRIKTLFNFQYKDESCKCFCCCFQLILSTKESLLTKRKICVRIHRNYQIRLINECVKIR